MIKIKKNIYLELYKNCIRIVQETLLLLLR